MSELLILGSGAALTDGSREPTMLALRGPHSTVLIDCGANVVRQLQQLGVPLDSIERLILTHSHPDHTSGFGLLVEMLWLSGRRAPLPVHALPDTIDVARRLFAPWDTHDWKGLPELHWHPVSTEIGAPIITGVDFEMTAAPGEHSVPVIGVRARDLQTGRALVYSADGQPSAGIRKLAQDADLLVHEATGHYPGHSTAEDAAHLARAAQVKKLILVHLAPLANDLAAQRTAAMSIFGDQVFLGRDLDRYEF